MTALRKFFRKIFRPTCRRDPEHGIHYFEGRYEQHRTDITPSDVNWLSIGIFRKKPFIADLLFQPVFIRDVCVYCGTVIERLDQPYMVNKPKKGS